ncbi:MAG: flagellar biosynthesis [Clostridia bacterium]|nr:MAG: flagellar biosynthesis [Clostridia bacterium]
MTAGNAPEESGRRRAAAALRYDESRDNAPRVVASGRGVVAENIIRRAREAGIPVHEDAELVEALCRLRLDTEIPPELYLAVAQVLAFIFRLEAGAKASGENSLLRGY